ncbi:hypothetical protein FRC03_001378 [Tulasnella sp. 419]|nr:hypothetical protein FRC03_001378 [Tulasnella sp. 419]
MRTASLASLSFKLHQELSDEFNGEKVWGYRRVTTMSVEIGRNRRKSVPGADWLNSVSKHSELGTPQTTAQVLPGAFTQTIAQAAEKQGVQITIANVEELHDVDDGTREVIAIDNDGKRISFMATDVVFAAGPWTGKLAKKLLGKDAGPAANIVPSDCSTSIILQPAETTGLISPHALFTELTLPDGSAGHPEVYPRPDGTVYLCGGASDPAEPLPDKAKDVKSNAKLAQKLRRMAAFVSPSHLSETASSLEIEQACFRPNSARTGAPIIGSFGNGLWIASGHQVWGINNGPGTGKCLAELMLDGKSTSAHISELAP